MTIVFIRTLSILIISILMMMMIMLHSTTSAELAVDRSALLSFISQTPHASRLHWNSSSSSSASPCTWTGVTCDQNSTFVYSLRLPGVGLVGPIPDNTIGRLSQLRILSLRSNRLSGPIPSDFANLTLLRSLYLQDNEFSGEIGLLTKLNRLIRLDLSSNRFSGEIPSSINDLTRLKGLFLERNNFSGQIPRIDNGILDFNVAENQLSGSIPETLTRFPASSFEGNPGLCGTPLPPCRAHRKLSIGAIIGIAVAGGVVLAVLVIVCLVLCLRGRRSNGGGTNVAKPAEGDAAEAGTSSSKEEATSGAADGERSRLVFLDAGGGSRGGDGRVYGFDLEDLLRASAEVLGKGSMGTSYKAVLEEGTTVVVKRLKDVTATKGEFEAVMGALGKCKHENVVALRAYYYSKDEKLLVLDYFPAGSLSALLHGSRGSGKTPLDWDSRVKVALATARGISYLHVSVNVVHGNIKSSNILLRDPTNSASAAVTDFGLRSLFSAAASQTNRAGGYRAPEVIQTRKVTYKSDVYNYGVLLLELLTGKSPNQASLGDEGIDLPRWVQSVVKEEWTAEVFDIELMTYNNIEEEMVQLLQIAMACVSIVPDQRPDMPQVVRMIEEMVGSDGQQQLSDDPSKELFVSVGD